MDENIKERVMIDRKNRDNNNMRKVNNNKRTR